MRRSHKPQPRPGGRPAGLPPLARCQYFESPRNYLKFLVLVFFKKQEVCAPGAS